MRSTTAGSGAVLLALLGLFALACDTNDPAQVETQVVTVSFNAGSATADTYIVWEMIRDDNADNVADDGQTYLWCENRLSNDPQVQPISVPWTFSAKIEVIPAGTSVPVPVTSQGATEADANVAVYHPSTSSTMSTRAKVPISEGTSTYRFANPRFRSALDDRVAFATSNPLAAARGNPFGTTCPAPVGSAPSTSKTRCGLCAQTNIGPPRLDGTVVGGQVECNTEAPDQCVLPWTITINKGDTIVVQGRLADESPIGVGLREVINMSPTSLSATVQVDGRQVPLQGSAAGRSLSFSYTSR